MILIFCNIHKKTHVLESLFNKGAIHKGSRHIRGGGGSGKSGKIQTGRGGGGKPNVDVRLEKNYSYHICEIYSDK